MSGEPVSEGSGGIEGFVAGARALLERSIYLLVSHQARFLSPLVSTERDRLRGAEALADPAVQRVVSEVLLGPATAERDRSSPPVIFFPVPLARVLAAGGDLDEALVRFHYDLIHVDQEQRWTWRQRPVAERTREFFLGHTRWEPELERWLFEYKVNDGWWDKSYLDAEVTPFVAISIESGEGSPRAVVRDGRRVPLRLERARLDGRERLFLETVELGEVMCSEALRFRLLSEVSEDLSWLPITGVRVPLG